jgi:hypothetical protein
MSLLLATITGEYVPVGDPNEADSVFAASFGTSTGPDTVNAAIKKLSYNTAPATPLIMERSLVESYPYEMPAPEHILEGEVSNIKGGGLGTWGVAVDAVRYMKSQGLYRPQIVAQAHHAPRVWAQLVLVGQEVFDIDIKPILTTNLPKKFDPESDQKWTQSKAKWVAFAPVIMFALKRRGQL